jgi:hypothetical protein
VEEFEDLAIAQWDSYFEMFSRTHRGWLVRMWVVNTVSLESGMLDNTAMVIRDLALWDISTVHLDDRVDLVVMTGDSERRSHSDHPIAHIESIKIERDPDGEETGLLITTADMQTTVLRLRVPSAPETADGLAPHERA